MIARGENAGPGIALASAALFGASAPLAKLLIGAGVAPQLLAGLLYLGSGAGLFAVRLAGSARGGAPREAPLARADWPWLALIVLMGGVLGPVLLMIGLAESPAASASLLLNVEGLATMVIAWVVFRENVDERLLIGAAAILAGAVILSWRGGPEGLGPGAVAIVAACLCWAADNNLTLKISGADPAQIAMIKGLAAGAVNLALALAFGQRLPGAAAVGSALALGFVSYGLSLTLFILALRRLG